MRSRPLAKFRYSAAITIAAVIALIGSIPLAATRWWLAPVALIPIVIGLWSWRVGVDADAAGVRVRSVFAARRIPWADIEGFTTGDGKVQAVLRSQRVVPLPAVRPADLPRLVAAAGRPLVPAAPDDGTAAAVPAGGDAAPVPAGRDAEGPAAGEPSTDTRG